MPSRLRLSNISFINFSGTSNSSQREFLDFGHNPHVCRVLKSNLVVNLNCSAAAPCPNIFFKQFQIHPPEGETPQFVCINVIDEQGLPGMLHTMLYRSK